jgi:hypothetical protein
VIPAELKDFIDRHVGPDRRLMLPLALASTSAGQSLAWESRMDQEIV